MGECFVTFYRNKIKQSWKTAFFSAVIIAFFAHFFKFTNVLPVSDSMYNLYNSQNMVSSGRWFLSAACALTSYFDLPWLNGVVSVFFMGLAAAAVAEVFEMKNPCLIALSSGLLVTFPAISATLSYSFTSDGYMIAMFLAALSVCLSKITPEFSRKTVVRGVLSSVCICLACGIYQAYVSFAFILALSYFIVELLENRYTDKAYFRWIGSQILIYVAALAVYYGLWKGSMQLLGLTATEYQGMNAVGQMDWVQIKYLPYKIIKEFKLFLLEWEPGEFGYTRWSVLNIAAAAAMVLGACWAAIKSGCWKRPLHFLLLAMCFGTIPFGCYILMFTSPDVNYHALMLQSVCVIYILLAVLWDRWFKPRYSTVVTVLLAAIIFNNSICANIYYQFLDQCIKKTQAVATELNTRVHLLDDGTVKNIAILGKLDVYGDEAETDPQLLREIGPWKFVPRTLLSEMFLHTYTDFNLSYYRQNGLEFPKAEFDRGNLPVPKDWDLYFPTVSDGEKAALMDTEAVKAMPIWPAADSVQVLGDTIVIKLSEPAKEE